MLTLTPAMPPTPQTTPAPNTTTTTTTSSTPAPTLHLKTGLPRGEGGGKKAKEQKVHLAEAHTKVFDAFSRAFSRQNVQFEKGEY